MHALVTGAGGFLGNAIARALLERGHTVASLARSSYPALDALGVRTHQGDLATDDDVLRAAEGADVVFHVAAKAGVWGPRDAYWRPNVLGTRNILEACRAHGIPRLIYTSTPSVVHAGHDVAGLDESAPYAERYETWYPETKAIAEREVLAAASESFGTVALRPHLIWGPGDNHLVPRILDRRRRGKLRFVGDGTNRIDATYIDNAAAAHLDALDHLAPGAPCSGRAYFIANDEPIETRALINGICEAGGLPPVDRTIPPGVAWAAGGLLELVWRVLGRDDEPMMTRFVARQLATEHFYDLSAARRDLGYHPRVSTAEGLRRLRAHLSGDDAANRASNEESHRSA